MNPRVLSPELVREAALVVGVCLRPVVSKVTVTETGETRLVPIACGSAREPVPAVRGRCAARMGCCGRS
jgi:hypothetical protein